MSAEASTSISFCECKKGYYDRALASDQVECVLCMVGSDCNTAGTTLDQLPLSVGYYRITNSWHVGLSASAASVGESALLAWL